MCIFLAESKLIKGMAIVSQVSDVDLFLIWFNTKIIYF